MKKGAARLSEQGEKENKDIKRKRSDFCDYIRKVINKTNLVDRLPLHFRERAGGEGAPSYRECMDLN